MGVIDINFLNLKTKYRISSFEAAVKKFKLIKKANLCIVFYGKFKTAVIP
jgi:hypothetical protein